MTIYALGDDVPQIDPTAWVHPDAIIIGTVRIEAAANIWPTAVLRGDFGEILVGRGTSVQDGVVVHAGRECPTRIAEHCAIGHNAYLEGCTIETGVLIGSSSCVLPHVTVGAGAVVAAGAVVTRGTQVPPGALARGVPALIVDSYRDLGLADNNTYELNAERYAATMRAVTIEDAHREYAKDAAYEES
jgi:carbonic anhydrase/acetyltransferase-like protein (isoleucine patch superfamily)